MSEIWAQWALTAEGWKQDVVLQIDAAGRIESMISGVAARDGTLKTGVLLPALANLHSHAFQRAMAGLTERRGSQANDSFWTWRQWMYKFVQNLQPDQVQAIAAQVQMEMLEAGYASIGEFHYLHHTVSGQPYSNLAEMSERMVAAAHSSGIGLTLLPVLYQRGGCDGRALAGGQLRFGNDLERYLRLLEAASASVSTLPNDARCGVALHSLRAVDAQAVAHFSQNNKHGPTHIHIAEQVAEIEEVQAAMGARPVQWLMDNADVDENWCLIHATHMDDDETSRLARSGAVAGLCPITEANLGDGIFNGAAYRQAQGRWGIGSDSNVRIALAEELRLYEYSQRLQHRQRTVLARPECSNGRYLYESAAVGGAQALGRDSGKLAVGALADIVALDGSATALFERRDDELLDSWLFAADDHLVEHVWSAGRHVVQNGRHVRRDEITQQFKASMQNLMAQEG